MILLRRWVVDTNTLVSRLLLPESTPAKAVNKALEYGELLFCDETLEELARVLNRPKFDKYLIHAERKTFFSLLSRLSIRVEIVRPVQGCRDPKDDKFLSVAVNGSADGIVSVDQDLLVLHPYQGIPIWTPQQFLAELSS